MTEEARPKIKPGECIWCRIEAAEPGGYSVSVESRGISGFLPSTRPIELGVIVPSTFVCMNGDRALFTFAYTMGTSARVQHSTASDQENAFSVWADAFPKAISIRRAVDLVMPPLDASLVTLKLDIGKADQVLSSLEETGFCGCVKIFCQSSFSRSALIFLDGRVVGSLYTKKPNRDPYPLDYGIKELLKDLSDEALDADLEMYELPREICVSMSSLFLGYTDEPDPKLSKSEYLASMLAHFARQKDTACFNLLEEDTDTPFALGFVFAGDFHGSYLITERLYSKESGPLTSFLESGGKCKLQVHILPAAMISDSIRFGFSLSSDQFRS